MGQGKTPPIAKSAMDGADGKSKNKYRDSGFARMTNKKPIDEQG
jgi:hypothetical protein